MTRYMFDATHLNVSAIPSTAEYVAGYDTGSADIKWTAEDWHRFPSAHQVHVDQKNGPRVLADTVQDVEPGAYAVSDIPEWQRTSTAARPTAYVNGSELDAALAASDGDIWLAKPDITDDDALAIMAANPRIVAVQNLWTSTFDRSVIGDPTWPEAKKVTTPVTPPVATPTGPAPVENAHATALATVAQINMAWQSTTACKSFEWQVERQVNPTSWILEVSGSTSDTFATARVLAPASPYRFRVSNGTWSDWVTITTP